MKNLENNLLFKSINKNDLPLLLKCLQANKITYQKDQTIIHQGQSINEIGILLSGKAHIINDDYWGNQTIIKEIDIGELFGEAYAFLPKQNTMISIIAKEKCEILYLNISKIIFSCNKNCHYHHLFIQNLLIATSQKNIMLTQKINHITKRTTREKILAYLSDLSKIHNSNAFNIPFNRQQLANYLAVDRSALSFELTKMQKEGIIRYKKNYFELL